MGLVYSLSQGVVPIASLLSSRQSLLCLLLSYCVVVPQSTSLNELANGVRMIAG